MDVKVLGSGCAKCNALEKAVKDVLVELGLPADVDHVTDFREYMKYGVMQTPALVIDGKAVVSGRIPNKAELTNIITTADTNN